jgi:serine/threonine-protein kinase
VPASGGEPTALTQPDGTQQLSPRVLPGGRGVLITVVDGGQGNVQIAVLDLRTGQRTTLLRGGQDAKYVDLGPTGYLVYAAEDALRAVRFNPRTLEASGDPVRVVEHISAAGRSEASYDVSRTGTLVYVPGAAVEDTAPRLLALVDRNGRETELKAPPRPYVSSRFSPDGTRLAVDVGDQKRDVWVWDFRSETLRRLTFEAGNNQQPIWTPDGQRIIFASSREGRYQSYRQAADGHGAVEQLTTGLNSFFSTSITPDGSRLVGAEATPTTLRDISLFSLTARRIEPLIQTKFDDLNGEISPDGRYLSYQSNESGRFEIYVRPFPRVNDGRWQVSSLGGSRAAWAPNGREIFYLDESNTLTAVPVQTGEAGFTMGNPTRMFKPSYAVPQVYRAYDISPDGRQFLMIKQAAAVNQAATASMVVVLNWTEELRRRVPTK